MGDTGLYRDTVLDHHRAPRNRGVLDPATHRGEALNRLCGDHVLMSLRLREGRIEALRHAGEACAIATAAASMLSELARGCDAEAIAALRARLDAFLEAAPEEPGDAALGELNALRELRRHPARHACARLPFDALATALASPVGSTP